MGSNRLTPRRIIVFTPEAGGFYVGDLLAGIDDVCVRQDIQHVVVQTAVGWQASMVNHAPTSDYYRLGGNMRLGIVVITATATIGSSICDRMASSSG